MNWRIEQPTLTYRLINARRRSGTLHALYPNEIESSSGTAVKHTNARKQTCTHVSWLVHRVENVYARLYHGRGYWLLCPTASDIAYRATISQIITPLANLVWKNRTMDFQSKSPPLHDEFDFDEYSLFDFSVSSRGHVVHRWPKKSGEKGGRLAWLRVAEFKRPLKPFPCIRDHRGAFQYRARARPMLIGVASRSSCAYTSAKRGRIVFRFVCTDGPALPGIDCSFALFETKKRFACFSH